MQSARPNVLGFFGCGKKLAGLQSNRNRDPYFLKEKRMGHMPTFMDAYFPIKLAALLPPARSHKHGLQCQ